MTEPHYGHETKKRTAPILAQLIQVAGPAKGQHAGPWFDPDKMAEGLGVRVGTLQSKGREVNDYHHRHLGLIWERRKNPDRPAGANQYRFVRSIPEQLPLLEGEQRHA